MNGRTGKKGEVKIFSHESPEFYEYLSKYKDLVLVCGVSETCEKVKQYGKTIYLPLSIPVDEIKQYRTTKTKEVCYAVGRTALEAKVLGCKILAYDLRFPNPKVWEVFGTKDAIKLL